MAARPIPSHITKYQIPDAQIVKSPVNGILILDKPAGMTSHDVVNRVRRILQQRAVGHLGTLDPLATGVLPLVTGNMTRLAQFYTAVGENLRRRDSLRFRDGYLRF